MKDKVTLSIEVGYELRTVELTAGEWSKVQLGEELHKTVQDFYEGSEFNYEFHFNSQMEPDSSLVVTYDDGGVGFVGDISDALFSTESK
jgi:hypothetical protein